MKPRAPGSHHDALNMICAGLGFERVREIVGKSESHIRGWTDPDNEREISFAQAMLLEEEAIRTSGQRPLTSVWVKRMEAIGTAAQATESLPVSIMDVTAQLGQLAMTAREILKDKVVTPAERNQLLRDISKLRTELDELELATHASCPGK